MKASLGSILVNEALPKELRDYSRVWDKGTTKDVLDVLAKRYPESYKDVVDKLHTVGGLAAYLSGHSVSLEDVRGVTIPRSKTIALRKAIDQIHDQGGPLIGRNNQILKLLGDVAAKSQTQTLDQLAAEGNPLAMEVLAGARGNATQLNSMVGSAVLMLDQNDNPAPIPVANSFAQGLTPAEYWAQSYGTRKGAVATKLSTAQSGYLSKQLALAAHRLLASDDELQDGIGLPVDARDADNVGTVLAAPVGDYKAGTVITPSMLKRWPKGTKKILVRSPISDIARNGGVPQRALGIREKGTFPGVGEQVGIPAIQTITEQLSQGSLNVKHEGGAGGVRKAGFPVINQLLQVPKVFPDGAAHSAVDGSITGITDAPQGGKYIWIGEDKYYVSPEQEPIVDVGSKVEAGDVLSNGLPNPSVIVEHKGIGEGRKYFMELMRDVLEESRMPTNRRNIEIMARSVINHVQVMDESDAIPGALPGDIMEYDRLASTYIPREGTIEVPSKSAKRGYLERPVLHYSIGTRLTPKVNKTLKRFGVGRVAVHPDPPPFRPAMSPVLTNLAKSPDWLERLGSFFVSRGLQESVHRGASSSLDSLSYIPRIISGRPLTGLGST